MLSSRKENFGLAAAEAVAGGLPAVVTEGCGVGPLLDGRAGMICGQSPEEIAGAIHGVLTEPGLLERLQAGARAGDALDGRRMVRQMEDLYAEVTGTTTRQRDRPMTEVRP